MFPAFFRRPIRVLALAALMALAVAACSDDTSTEDSAASETTATTTVESTTTTAGDTTTTTAATTTTTTVAEPEVPDPSATVLVYGGEARSNANQTESTESDGVNILTLEYVDTIEVSDPRASGTAEWTAVLYSPEGDDLGGTWVSEGATLTNDGGTWVGYRLGTYGFTRNMPNAVSTTPGVKTGEVHLVGRGGYKGLRMDLYTSSDGYVGTISPMDAASADKEEASALADVAATADTTMVNGSRTDYVSTQTGSELEDGVEIVTIDVSESLEMSDPRASGAMEYTSVLTALEADVGGVWTVEEVAITNQGGQWVGGAQGSYVYTEYMPTALTSDDTVVIGEWHLLGTGEYDGLRMDLYTSSDGVVGSIRPVE